MMSFAASCSSLSSCSQGAFLRSCGIAYFLLCTQALPLTENDSSDDRSCGCFVDVDKQLELKIKRKEIEKKTHAWKIM